MNDNPVPLSRDELLRAYRMMKTIREFEERVHVEFATGDLPGFVHLYAGEEASGAGIMMNLRKDDNISSTHRGHGHCIAKGVEVKGMVAELYGRSNGTCHGKGGSMHIADLDMGMMGANGILGAGAPLACGAALASKYKKDGSVGVSFLGDGASNAGNFLESLNLAAVWEIPAIFVVENNGYAQSTSRDYAVAVDSYVDRASGFGMPGVTVDGTDFFAVHEAAGEMINRARKGGGPSLLECNMIRFYGHFEGDAQTYRGLGEVEEIRKNRDCLKKFIQQVTHAEALTHSDLDGIDQEISVLINEAFDEAQNAPRPTEADLLTDVYISY
ncbi:MAG: ABC transporter substrate-binding protein [Deltaproteobacteria bacterium]|jgi:pyruvate dehydrogenase E1 component alpha subunit|nr:ABC transporter substrate-binding protein [Deltaproteobacteria bacterium]